MKPKRHSNRKIITLDLPPTTNHSYASSFGHWYKTSKARDWDEKALWKLKALSLKPILGFVEMDIVFYLKRDRDIDGGIKPVLDILAKGKAYKNDSQVVKLVVIKAKDEDFPRCEVSFVELV